MSNFEIKGGFILTMRNLKDEGSGDGGDNDDVLY